MLKHVDGGDRQLRSESLNPDLAVVGGGMAGTCAAITAARQGLQVVLLQDRPVLGGNASSEVRLWTLGATSHMSNNNRWAREGGVIDELMVENLWRNPEGNALLFDALLLEKVVEEPNITLLLNTAAFEVEKSDPDTIASVKAICSQNSTFYNIKAPLWCDASGDGILGFLSGAAFRIGAEASDEFDEKFAPTEEYGQLLGHSIYFYSKDVGRPVQFVPPSFALGDIDKKIPRFRAFNARDYGCRLWWIEYGGRLDTVHDTEKIKWELWRVVYGVWDYIKNSGEFPDAANLTLEWIGHIPGKRESRRFEGDFLLSQRDLIEQKPFDDAVAFGGWSIDLHPADGVFFEKPGCNQWHAKGIYPIPYRSLYSRNISNLFLAGRTISATHVAFGSTRVMATCAHAAQAVGVAAAICQAQGKQPRDLNEPELMQQLQRDLNRTGQHIPNVPLQDAEDLVPRARISTSSEFALRSLPADGPLVALDYSRAQMLPVDGGQVPDATFHVDVARDTTLQIELRASSKIGNATPDVVLWSSQVELKAGENQPVRFGSGVQLEEAQYVFFCFLKNEDVQLRASNARLSGVLSLTHRQTQTPRADVGIESFEFWRPDRRPAGWNFALELSEPIALWNAASVSNGWMRPTTKPNCWMPETGEKSATLRLEWDETQTISRIELGFDTDFDHPMESVLWGHPERAMPFCVRVYRVQDETGKTLAERTDNHQTRNTIRFQTPISTASLTIEVQTEDGLGQGVLDVRCYGTS